MSTFLIIKPDFEKNHESEKGLDTIRQHAKEFIAKREAPAYIANYDKDFRD